MCWLQPSAPQNGWTDRVAYFFGYQLRWAQEPSIRWGPGPPREGRAIGAKFGSYSKRSTGIRPMHSPLTYLDLRRPDVVQSSLSNVTTVLRKAVITVETIRIYCGNIDRKTASVDLYMTIKYAYRKYAGLCYKSLLQLFIST